MNPMDFLGLLDSTPLWGVSPRPPLPIGGVERIAFGSCMRASRDHSIWNAVVGANPDLFVHLGDAIYPDVNDEGTGGHVPLLSTAAAAEQPAGAEEC